MPYINESHGKFCYVYIYSIPIGIHIPYKVFRNNIVTYNYYIVKYKYVLTISQLYSQHHQLNSGLFYKNFSFLILSFIYL